MWVKNHWTYKSFRNTIPARMRVPHWLGRLLARLAIASVLVFGCYQLEWHWLRNITTSIIVWLSHSLALPVNQLAHDVVEMNGTYYGIYISCTMIDVFFAAAALMWNTQRPFLRNLLRLVYLFFFVFALNILRLEIGFQLLYRLHVPNIVAHEIVGGIAYFIVLVKVVDTGKNKVHDHLANNRRSSSLIPENSP